MFHLQRLWLLGYVTDGKVREGSCQIWIENSETIWYKSERSLQKSQIMCVPGTDRYDWDRPTKKPSIKQKQVLVQVWTCVHSSAGIHTLVLVAWFFWLWGGCFGDTKRWRHQLWAPGASLGQCTSLLVSPNSCVPKNKLKWSCHFMTLSLHRGASKSWTNLEYNLAAVLMWISNPWHPTELFHVHTVSHRPSCIVGFGKYTAACNKSRKEKAFGLPWFRLL